MIAVWQKKGQQMVQVDKGARKTKQEAATGPDFLALFLPSLYATARKFSLSGNPPHGRYSPFLQTEEKLLVRYLPDFMRFCAFSGASVRNGFEGRIANRAFIHAVYRVILENGLGGTRTHNQRLKRALLYH